MERGTECVRREKGVRGKGRREEGGERRDKRLG